MKITIERFNPKTDAAPHAETYDVDYWDKITALEAINWVSENIEPIAFDYNCRGRICGRCAITLDGQPVLGCVTTLTDSDHTIAPQIGFPVIRDLVVDKSQALNRLALRYNRVRSTPITEEEAMTYNMDAYEKINGMEWCARCQNCQVACPVFTSDPDKYVGPSFMLATAFRYYDPYDQSDRVVEAVQGGLWNCIMCGQCSDACEQEEIDHVSIWQDLRDAATAQGLSEEVVKAESQKTDGSLIYAAYATEVTGSSANKK